MVIAVKAGSPSALEEARIDALVAVTNAAVAAYHLADIAVVDRPAWVPLGIGYGRGDARKLCEHLKRAHCVMLRSGNPAVEMTTRISTRNYKTKLGSSTLVASLL